MDNFGQLLNQSGVDLEAALFERVGDGFCWGLCSEISVITRALPHANKFLWRLVVWNVSGGTTWQKAGVCSCVRNWIRGWELKTFANAAFTNTFQQSRPSYPQLLPYSILESGINCVLSFCLVRAVPFPWNSPPQPPPSAPHETKTNYNPHNISMEAVSVVFLRDFLPFLLPCGSSPNPLRQNSFSFHLFFLPPLSLPVVTR